MLAIASPRECYRALLERNPEYEGVFFVGVKTTGVFCRPTCPARKPRFENCEFFDTAAVALDANYRPCRRCRPLCPPGRVPDLLQTLIDEVDRNPKRRWTANDFRALGVDESTARRQFKKRFGMTFVEYARAHRVALAARTLNGGGAVIDAQFAAGYASGSGFREAFARIIGVPPARAEGAATLAVAWLDTPLGTMTAIGDEQALHLLEFADRPELEREVGRLREHTQAAILPGRTAPIDSIEAELEGYFAGQFESFTTPFYLHGTPFQQQVWTALRAIPFGEVCNYSDLAIRIGRPTAVRAVARANETNTLAIVVPCHRVIGKSGDLTGYGGGLARKRWLLRHESKGG